jgi:hypothetical protein
LIAKNRNYGTLKTVGHIKPKSYDAVTLRMNDW